MPRADRGLINARSRVSLRLLFFLFYRQHRRSINCPVVIAGLEPFERQLPKRVAYAAADYTFGL